MNIISALRESIEICEGSSKLPESGPCSYEHFVSMWNRIHDIEKRFSIAKINRWLGYIQGVMVALEVSTLEEVKEINKRNS